MSNNKQEQKTLKDKILTIVGTVLCVILVPILIINLTLIVKSYVNEDEVPSIGGTFPLIVLTDSMYPEIHSGDLIICHTVDPEDVEVGDIISFYDPAGNGTSVVTHRVLEITTQNNQLAFKTKGDANNTEDKLLVEANDLIGAYQTRIPNLGNVAIFMQSSTGLIVCVVLPIILLVGYDLVRRKMYEKNKEDDMAALRAELEALKKEKEAANN